MSKLRQIFQPLAHQAKLNLTKSKKPTLVFSALSLLAVIILALGSFLIFQKNQASSLLKLAKSYIPEGKYEEADRLLNKAEKLYVFGSTKAQISSSLKENKQWLNDDKKLQQSNLLVEQNKFDEATLLLNLIDKRFPTYSKVTQLQKLIAAKQKAAAEQVAAEALKKSAAAAGPSEKKAPSNKPSATGSQACYQITGPSSRATSDLADETSGYQIHIIYALPSDGADHSYDTNNSISNSVSAWNNWLCNQTGGKKLRLDTHQGRLDITFVRFNESDNTIKTGGDLPWSTNPDNNPYVRDSIEIHLKEKGFNNPSKLYAVYYDGTSNYACGGSAFPPTLTGHVAARYLHGGPTSSPTICDSDKFPAGTTNLGYIEYGLVHEIIHTLGLVASCAPHNTATSHVSDSNTDLMYAGPQNWYPSVLDVNHDDYYSTGNPNCLDLINSTFLVGGGSQLPPSW